MCRGLLLFIGTYKKRNYKRSWPFGCKQQLHCGVLLYQYFSTFINALKHKYSMHSLFPPGTLSLVCSETHSAHRLPLKAIVRDRHLSIHYASIYWIHKQETASQKHTSQRSLLHRCQLSGEASQRHTDRSETNTTLKSKYCVHGFLIHQSLYVFSVFGVFFPKINKINPKGKQLETNPAISKFTDSINY